MKRIEKSGAMILLLPVLAAVVLVAFAAALTDIRLGHAGEDKRQLEDALHRAAVACYAAEGIYPPDVEYLKTYYGIQVDEDRYTVMYDIFATNLMPDITVLEKAR